MLKGAAVGSMPVGGVETGSGGTAGPESLPLFAAGGATAAVAAGAFVLLGRRTTRPTLRRRPGHERDSAGRNLAQQDSTGPDFTQSGRDLGAGDQDDDWTAGAAHGGSRPGGHAARHGITQQGPAPTQADRVPTMSDKASDPPAGRDEERSRGKSTGHEGHGAGLASSRGTVLTGPSPSGSRFPRSASTRPWRTGEQVMETPDAADKAGWFAPGPTPRARACRHRRSCHLERPVGRDLRHPLRGLDRGPDFDNVLGTVVRAVTQLSSHRPCAPASPIHDPRTHLGDGSVAPTPGSADTREAQDVPLAGGIGLSDIQRFPAALRRSAHCCPVAAARLSPCR